MLVCGKVLGRTAQVPVEGIVGEALRQVIYAGCSCASLQPVSLTPSK
jgi:hypothetical protein